MTRSRSSSPNRDGGPSTYRQRSPLREVNDGILPFSTREGSPSANSTVNELSREDYDKQHSKLKNSLRAYQTTVEKAEVNYEDLKQYRDDEALNQSNALQLQKSQAAYQTPEKLSAIMTELTRVEFMLKITDVKCEEAEMKLIRAQVNQTQAETRFQEFKDKNRRR